MIDPREQFAPLLDPTHMEQALRRHLPECVAGEWNLDACEIQNPRYKTFLSAENRQRSSLSLVYRLRGRAADAALAEHRILYARAYLGNRSLSEFELAFAAANPERRGALLHFQELGVVGWRFPQDPAMPWLAELLDPARAGALMPGDCQDLQCLGIEVINYRPETRCTSRYCFRSGTSEKLVYGKTYADNAGSRIHENLRALHLQAHAVGTYAMPRPLGYDTARHTLWLEGLQGEPLPAALRRNQDKELINSLCQGLAGFHGLDVPHLESITSNQLLQEWRKKSRKLAHAYAQLGATLADLVAELERQQPAAEIRTLIHGDFHAGQLSRLEDGRLALFDFDELASGDPWQDVANFAADLFVQPLDYESCADLAKQLLTAYQHQVAELDGPARFLWHLRGQLLTRAYRAHIQQKPETEQLVTRLVDLALCPFPTDPALNDGISAP